MPTIVISGIVTVVSVIGLLVFCKTFKRETMYDTVADSGWFWLLVCGVTIGAMVLLISVVMYNTAVTTINMFSLSITPEQYMVLDEEGRTRLLGTVNHVIIQ